MTEQAQTPYQRHVPIIGKRLFRLAVAWSREQPATQKEREARIEAMRGRKRVINGSRSKRAAREAVEAAVAEIHRAREMRHVLHRQAARQERGHALPAGSLEERLQDRLERDLAERLRAHYRCDKPGSIRVTPTRNPKLVGRLSQWRDLDRDYYGSSSRYPKEIVGIKVFPPRDWRVRVLREGLDVVDGLLTLDARRCPVEEPGDLCLYLATWVEQRPGYWLTTQSGYIAVAEPLDLGKITYHAATARKAIQGLRRKRTQLRRNAELDHLIGQGGLEAVVAQHPEVEVRLADAEAIGACETGIRQWCESVGLDYTRSAANIREIYAGYQRNPAPEARAAMIKAVRRRGQLPRRGRAGHQASA